MSLLRRDPSGTATIRRVFSKELRDRLLDLQKRVYDLIVTQDAFGLNRPEPITSNTRWTFATSAEKLKEFRSWLGKQLGDLFYKEQEDSWWREYIAKGWLNGQGRVMAKWKNPTEFLNRGFNNPVPMEKVRSLCSRVLEELKNVTHDMATKMMRTLADGLTQGQNPKEIARNMTKAINISKPRAMAIAQTEIIRANAEGTLDQLQALGIDRVGVLVEWSTSHLGITAKKNPSPCPKCKPMEGKTFTIQEARGQIPFHTNCKCCWVPANVGEDKKPTKNSYHPVSQSLLRARKRFLAKG